ncbi:MAG TPA: IS256 family transposase, partial [Geminicoccaceae bacterium]|nr:IS256 family transposase [Geminicoccaceae bacterium]
MTDDRLPVAELLQKAGDGDFLRAVAEAVLQLLMEADVEGLIGAGRHERSPERLNYRNGYRERALDTRLGSLQLRIPKLRQGAYFPPFLEPRKTSEKALVAVIQEAWIGGVSTRRVDELVQAMGLAGISRSTVSKLCKDIDERVNAFLGRPLEGEWPYLWLDATYLRQREGGRIVSVAAIIAVAVDAEGRREIVGLHIGPSEAGAFWSTFLKGLVRRGLKGVKLVVSDAHEGLKGAIRRVLGATWQRCRVHTIRTQSTVRFCGAIAARRRVAQRDDMADLQAGVVDEDALDHELQDGLLGGERGVVEPAAHARAERRQVRQDLAGLGPLLAEAALLVQLPAQGAALVGQLPPPLGQLLQADHLRLVGVEQPAVGARQALETRAEP